MNDTAGAGHRVRPYHVSDRQMAAGSTLGGPALTLRIKPTGAIERIWSVEAGCNAFGAVIAHYWDGLSGVGLTPLPGVFELHPHLQTHRFELSNGVRIEERLFALRTGPHDEGARVDPAAAFYAITLTNVSSSERAVETFISAELGTERDGTTQTRWDQRRRAFVVSSGARPDFVRVAGCRAPVESWEVTHDGAKASAMAFPGPLANTVAIHEGRLIGIVHLRTRLAPGETATYEVAFVLSTAGEEAALRAYDDAGPAGAALARTEAYFGEQLARALLMTPDADVNHAALWAKANMLRVASRTHALGWCFVNDPARTNNAVARDTAWFAFGADGLMPHFTRASLEWFAGHLRADGLVFEYADIRTGETEDYGLNVNDNTPLLVLAIWHHYAVTGDEAFLRGCATALYRMGEKLLHSRDERGLVWCSATGTGSRGIVGWRNVIDGYRLSGATTEVNSEAYAAFVTLSRAARALGDEETASRWDREAQALRGAINEHLLDPDRGIYYLNIDIDGRKRTDVTSDLVFPVIFGVADEETAARIVAHLSLPAFWSDAGIHTAPRTAISYSPEESAGLMGGIWPGVTFWFAFAAARFNAAFMAYALRVSFRHYASEPRRNNTVPGEFSEWLHGETLVNRGMMLSPWFPARYLWAAIEGAGGLELAGDRPALRPRPAPDWGWLAVRRASVRGREAAWFFARTGEAFLAATYPFDGVERAQLYDEDISDRVDLLSDHMAVAAFARPGAIAILAGNTLDRTLTAAIRLDFPGIERYAMRSYSSLRERWIDCPPETAHRLKSAYPIEIDSRGFTLLILTMEDS